MKELEALKIVDCYKNIDMNIGGQAPWLYFIAPEFAHTLDAPIPSQESVSQSRASIGGVKSRDSENLDDNF